MSESYGLNFNMALTSDKDGIVDLGVHITDTNGLDLDHKVSGKNFEKIVNELIDTLTNELMAVSNGRKQKKDKEQAEKIKKEREERAAKLADLKAKAEEIKKQIEDIEKDTKSTRTVHISRPSYESLLDQDFAHLLKMFA